MKNNFRTQETRQRLLEAATDVFAENGYRNATFREICLRAGANIAAVNYHFRDKEHFYSAVVEHVIEQEKDSLQEVQSRAEMRASAEARLQAFIRVVLNSLLKPERPPRLLRLLAREMMEPTPAMDLIVEKVARPVVKTLCGVISEILGEKAEPRLVMDCASSVLAQCVSYHHSRAVIARLGVYPVYDQATVDHLGEHITRFSLGALRSLRETLEAAAMPATPEGAQSRTSENATV